MLWAYAFSPKTVARHSIDVQVTTLEIQSMQDVLAAKLFACPPLASGKSSFYCVLSSRLSVWLPSADRLNSVDKLIEKCDLFVAAQIDLRRLVTNLSICSATHSLASPQRKGSMSSGGSWLFVAQKIESSFEARSSLFDVSQLTHDPFHNILTLFFVCCCCCAAEKLLRCFAN